VRLARTVKSTILVFVLGCLFSLPTSCHAQMASLLKQPDVRKELGLNDAQYEKIVASREAARAKITARMREIAVDRNKLNAMSNEELEKYKREVISMRQKLASDEDQQIETFLNAEQLKRLKEIHLQKLGTESIKLESVASQLGMSKDQIERANKIASDHLITCSAVRDRMKQTIAQEDFLQKFESKMLELQQELHAALAEVLTEDQSQKLVELQGENFEFAATASPANETKPAPAKRPRRNRGYVEVKIRGQLIATQGNDDKDSKFEIVAGDFRWKLDLTGGGRAPASQVKSMTEIAQRMNERTVMVEGRLVPGDGESNHVVIVELMTSGSRR